MSVSFGFLRGGEISLVGGRRWGWGFTLPVCGDNGVVEDLLFGFRLFGDFVEGGAVLLFLEFATHCAVVFALLARVDVRYFVGAVE